MDWLEKISPPMLGGGGKRCTGAENSCRRISHGRIMRCSDEHNRMINTENEADNSVDSDKRTQESNENSKQSVEGDANKCRKVASCNRHNEDSFKNKEGIDRGNRKETEDDCRNSRQIDTESLNRSSTSETIMEEDNEECWGDLDQMLKEFYQEAQSCDNSSSVVEGDCNKKDKQIENALDYISLGKDIAERSAGGIDRDTKGMAEGGMDSKGINRGVINTQGMCKTNINTVDIGRGSTGNGGLDTIGIGRGSISNEGFENGDMAKVGIHRIDLETAEKGRGGKGNVNEEGKSRERLSTGGMEREGIGTGDMSRGGIGRYRLDTEYRSRGVMRRGRLDTGSVDRGSIDTGGIAIGGLGREGVDTGGMGRGVDNGGMGRGSLDNGGIGRGGLDNGGMGRGSLDNGGMGRGGLDNGSMGRRESDVSRGGIGRGLEWVNVGKGTIDIGSRGRRNVENGSRSSKNLDVVHGEDIEKLTISWDNLDHILQVVCDETSSIVSGGNPTGLTEEYGGRDSWNKNHERNNQRRGFVNRNWGGRGRDTDSRISRSFGDKDGDLSRPDEEYVNSEGQASNTHGRNSISLDILELAQVNNCKDIKTLTGKDERGIEICQSNSKEALHTYIHQMFKTECSPQTCSFSLLSRRNESHVGKGKEIQALVSMNSENSANRIEGGIVKIKGMDKDTISVRVEEHLGRTQGILVGKTEGLIGEKCKTQDYDGRISEKRNLDVCSYQDQTNHLQGQNINGFKLENECLCNEKEPQDYWEEMEIVEEEEEKCNDPNLGQEFYNAATMKLMSKTPEAEQEGSHHEPDREDKRQKQTRKQKKRQKKAQQQLEQQQKQQNLQLQNRLHQIRQLQIQNQQQKPQQHHQKLQNSTLQWQQFQQQKQELQSKALQQFDMIWQKMLLPDQQQEQKLEQEKPESPKEGLAEGKVGKVLFTLAGHTVKNDSDAMLGVQVICMLLQFLKDHSCLTNSFQTFQVLDHALTNMDTLKWFMDMTGCY